MRIVLLAMFINAIFINGLNFVTQREFILSFIRNYLYANGWIGQVFYACVACMPTIWGTVGFTAVLWLTDSINSMWWFWLPAYNICTSFISVFIHNLFSLIIKKNTDG
jgi:hypothetical protein